MFEAVFPAKITLLVLFQYRLGREGEKKKEYFKKYWKETNHDRKNEKVAGRGCEYLEDVAVKKGSFFFSFLF